MDRITRFRLRVFLALIGAILCLFCFRLLKLNLDHTGEQAAASSGDTLTYRTTVHAARGDILDRNGKVLVSSRAGYNVDIINFVLLANDDPNGDLLRLLTLLDEKNTPTADHLPISAKTPYTYISDQLPELWRNHYSAFLTWKGWDPEMTAKNVIRRMKALYRIPESLSEEEARRLIGVRYELDLRFCTGLDNYSLAQDVSTDTLAAVLELGVRGVVAGTVPIREYRTKYAAHLLGRVAQIDAEEWNTYESLGYAMDAMVGKDGAEKAFESYLHNEDCSEYTTINQDGAVLETYRDDEPLAGNNISLTVDIDLQAAAENKLREVISELRRNGLGKNREGKDAEGGAVVAIQCKTGEVLASASYPTFDIANYSKDFQQLSQDPYKPIWNRALQAPYNPGSIYKMVTAIAAIDEQGIGRWRDITDRGVYRFYEDQGYTCNCHIYTSSGVTHGTINMMEALSESCNYYFYEVGRETGIDAIDKVAKGLGLGEDTGVEIYDAIGTRANLATKMKLHKDEYSRDWYGADTLQAAIGQSDNLFTPMQMANYCAVLANGGVRYDATFLKSVTSWDDRVRSYLHVPAVKSTYPLSEQAKAACLEGMLLAAKEGTASAYLKDYPIAVAAKTGTAQHGSGGSDHASFICYAPAEDPEIAIAIYVEKGAQGGNLGKIARAMLDVYFADDPEFSALGTEGIVN